MGRLVLLSFQGGSAFLNCGAKIRLFSISATFNSKNILFFSLQKNKMRSHWTLHKERQHLAELSFFQIIVFQITL